MHLGIISAVIVVFVISTIFMSLALAMGVYGQEILNINSND